MDLWQQIYETNVFSIVRMSKAVVPHMASRKRGMIINVGSILGQTWVVLMAESQNSVAYSVFCPAAQHPSQACTPLPRRPSTLSPTRSTWSARPSISTSCSSLRASSNPPSPSRPFLTSLRPRQPDFTPTTSRLWPQLWQLRLVERPWRRTLSLRGWLMPSFSLRLRHRGT